MAFLAPGAGGKSKKAGAPRSAGFFAATDYFLREVFFAAFFAPPLRAVFFAPPRFAPAFAVRFAVDLRAAFFAPPLRAPPLRADFFAAAIFELSMKWS
jgi:hypothetical protein